MPLSWDAKTTPACWSLSILAPSGNTAKPRGLAPLALHRWQVHAVAAHLELGVTADSRMAHRASILRDMGLGEVGLAAGDSVPACFDHVFPLLSEGTMSASGTDSIRMVD